jgi:hypothetical protein
MQQIPPVQYKENNMNLTLQVFGNGGHTVPETLVLNAAGNCPKDSMNCA